ncbi:hypothetical protein NBRC10512_006296 [Rhodotorula toruloides]|uniref:RHTO0S07e02278g1_1 n=2 Tax=Rhodotorula toruloides TaxID=5286 RepID=A0A061B4Q0_RHOTO|nr:uncharacterized protein RHTO_02765 [Rhodotorula toruloides NP11]EMS25038.1 hypothetical protein RHTO_02765 [Rhodotorula toruloides NP11]CDR42624.1 RHTO0S07e02278g1_1 [Rhodotorula toruloides]
MLLLPHKTLLVLCVLAILSACSAQATEWYRVTDDLHPAERSIEARLADRQVHDTLASRSPASHHLHPSVFDSKGSSPPAGPLYPTNPKALARPPSLSREKNVSFCQAKIKAAVGDPFSRNLKKRSEALAGAAEAVKAKRASSGRVTMGQLERRSERAGAGETVWKRVLEADDVIVEEAVEVAPELQTGEAQPEARPVAHRSRRSSAGLAGETKMLRREAGLSPVKRMEVRMKRSEPLHHRQ